MRYQVLEAPLLAMHLRAFIAFMVPLSIEVATYWRTKTIPTSVSGMIESTRAYQVLGSSQFI